MGIAGMVAQEAVTSGKLFYGISRPTSRASGGIKSLLLHAAAQSPGSTLGYMKAGWWLGSHCPYASLRRHSHDRGVFFGRRASSCGVAQLNPKLFLLGFVSS